MQSLTLLALHVVIDHSDWLAAAPRWLKGLYTVTLALQTFYLFSMVRLRDRLNVLPLLLAPLLF